MDSVQHFEIPYKSRDRAKKFYFDAFDWQLFDVPGTGYTFATTVETSKTGMPERAGAINGGLTARSEQLQGPTLLVRVGDVRAHLDRIRRAGGTILTEPMPMGPVLYARFRDPEGNVLGVIERREGGGEPTPKEDRALRTASKGNAKRTTKAGKKAKSAKKASRKR